MIRPMSVWAYDARKRGFSKDRLLNNLRLQIAAQKEEISKLTAALEFYNNGDNWCYAWIPLSRWDGDDETEKVWFLYPEDGHEYPWEVADSTLSEVDK